MAAAVQFIRPVVQTGISTSHVADTVFDAIREEKFYILTHPTTKFAVQLRMEDMLQDRSPTDIMQFMQNASSERQRTCEKDVKRRAELAFALTTYGAVFDTFPGNRSSYIELLFYYD